MLTYPNIDPIAFSIGSISVHWYGLMYLVGFLAAWLLGRSRAKRTDFKWQPQEVDDVIFYCAIGVIVGGRLGYVLFYDTANLIMQPLSIFMVWKGGMSFHGGLIGVLIACWLFSRKKKKTFFQVTDFVAPLVPLGLAAGRLGNFINGELWGRVTEMPWGMIFPAVDTLPRHPSQMYAVLFEGLFLFIFLWIYSSKSRPVKNISAVFLIGYGTIRFILEFFREPDAHMGFVAFHWLTMGQVLSLPMIIVGILLLTAQFSKISK